jgi:pyrroloquinoline quinone biosynthesis protein A
MMSGMSRTRCERKMPPSQFVYSIGRAADQLTEKEIVMWTKPQATEMRFGFEVTMYVCNR